MGKEKLNELIQILGKDKILAAYEIMGEEKISFARLRHLILRLDIEHSFYASKLPVARIAQIFRVSRMTIYRIVRVGKKRGLVKS